MDKDLVVCFRRIVSSGSDVINYTQRTLCLLYLSSTNWTHRAMTVENSSLGSEISHILQFCCSLLILSVIFEHSLLLVRLHHSLLCIGKGSLLMKARARNDAPSQSIKSSCWQRRWWDGWEGIRNYSGKQETHSTVIKGNTGARSLYLRT